MAAMLQPLICQMKTQALMNRVMILPQSDPIDWFYKSISNGVQTNLHYIPMGSICLTFSQSFFCSW